MSSVVELLAVALTGAVPLPYTNEQPAFDPELRSSDAILVQTSGSTGEPSIVRISPSNIAASVTASRERLGNVDADRWLACLPLNHVGGLAVVWRTLEAGGSLVLAPFDADLPELIGRSSPTIASLVPTMLHRLLDQDPSLLTDMRLVLVGGAAMPQSLVRDAVRKGVSVAPSYGMTEATSQIATSQVVSNLDSDWWPLRGIPLGGFTVSVESENGEQLGADVVGRILVDGPAVSIGYLGQPDRTTPFRTNDLGSIDTYGRLSVVGRSDDVIVSGGENVSLPSVASTIRGFDGVIDAVAIGMDAPEWGAVVGVMVEGDVDVEVLADAAAVSLAPHERPRRWVVVESLPALETGKPDLMSIRRSIEGL
jgi:O-succinylbenzoic acid--CoA ligase